MRVLFLLFSGALAAFSQPLTFGVKAGVPLTDFFDTLANPRESFRSETKQYIVGPTVELRLPAGFGIEFDALYRRFNYNRSLLDLFSASTTTGNAWEFPLLVKKKFGAGLVKPFVNGGVSFNHISGLKQITSGSFFRNRPASETPAELQNNFSTGVAVGFGIDFHALFLHVSPEIRYTRWGVENFRDINGLLRSNQNQAEFLVGITF